MNRIGPLATTGAVGWGRGERMVFCRSTGLGWRSMYVFMVFAFRLMVVWGVSPTTGGSAFRFSAVRNPRLIRRADTLLAFSESHTV